jgi:small GTP-binding protein
MGKQRTVYKIILIGEPDVGKKSITNQLVYNDPGNPCPNGLGVPYKTFRMSTESNDICLEIYGPDGQERFHSVPKMFYRRAAGAALVFALSSVASFHEIEYWRKDIQLLCGPDVVCVLVGNKSDLEDGRDVTDSEILEYADRHHMDYVEASAVSGKGIHDLFDRLVRGIEHKAVETDPGVSLQQGTRENAEHRISYCWC